LQPAVSLTLKRPTAIFAETFETLEHSMMGIPESPSHKTKYMAYSTLKIKAADSSEIFVTTD
jgi:hypothetical protein